jgi:hypothetical protein
LKNENPVKIIKNGNDFVLFHLSMQTHKVNVFLKGTIWIFYAYRNKKARQSANNHVLHPPVTLASHHIHEWTLLM